MTTGMPMVNSVLNFIKQNSMLQKGDNVIVALSGGADSMALFHFLLSVRAQLSLTVMAAHVNHGLRAVTSGRDADFVKQTCADLDVTLFTLDARLGEKQSPKGMGTEEWARQVRYTFFEKLAAEQNAKIATAHTASDNAETILFNTVRGTALKGLCGIPPVRDCFIRPLLTVTREQIEAYCTENCLQYVTDETNLQPLYSRNKIRLQVMPVLKQINSAAVLNMAQLSVEMRQIYNYIYKQAEMLLQQAKCQHGYDALMLRQAPFPVQKQALIFLLQPFCTPSSTYVALCTNVLLGQARQAQLSKNTFAINESGIFNIFKKENTCTNQAEFMHLIPLTIGENRLWDDFLLIAQEISAKEIRKILKINKKALKYFADYDKIQGTMSIRTRMQGDTFTLPYRGVTKSLKKLFIEDKLDAALRGRIPLVVQQQQVIWIYGYGFCDGLAPDGTTKRWLYIGPENLKQTGENCL
ncbi:MAG: tRNA lysidine(34) synthetase TilS [Oscillospiraceae bacterium]|nr:tRNA lysidine(34) synthetase TilS [Oscillospiraceae bacterium]